MSNINKILGTIIIISSAILYTIDRVSITIAQSIVEAGYASHGTVTNHVPINYQFPGLMIIFMFIIGFALLVAGFPTYNKKNNTVNNINQSGSND
jgi:uncharacterized protein YybS (DUF2232 family)